MKENKALEIGVKVIGAIAALYLIFYGIYYFITLKHFLPILLWFSLAIIVLTYQWMFRKEYLTEKKKKTGTIVLVSSIICAIIFVVIGFLSL